MKPVAVISNPKNVFRISHVISNSCNYTCDYCFPGCNTGTHPYFKDYKLMVKNLRHIFNHYQTHTNKNKFDINITGGEPTLWPYLQDYCYELQEQHDVMISLQSNGSRTLRWWEQHANIFSKVLLSYHHKEGNLEHFTNVADTCYEQGTFVVVTVCMDPAAWQKCLDAVEYFKNNSKHKWYIRIQKLEGNVFYSSEQNEYLLKAVKRLPDLLYAFKHRRKFYNKESKIEFDTGLIKKADQHEISTNGWNHFKGWECNLGVDSFQIGYDGRISGSCGQTLFKDINLYDPDLCDKFNPAIQPVVCQIDTCLCVPEINLSKKIIPLVRI